VGASIEVAALNASVKVALAIGAGAVTDDPHLGIEGRMAEMAGAHGSTSPGMSGHDREETWARASAFLNRPGRRTARLDNRPTRFHDPAMKASTGWMLGAMAFSLIVGGCATAKKDAPSTIAWNTAMDAALADAGKSGRPILLDFYTDW
jgi:hypothetical protein